MSICVCVCLKTKLINIIKKTQKVPMHAYSAKLSKTSVIRLLFYCTAIIIVIIFHVIFFRLLAIPCGWHRTSMKTSTR